MDFASNYAYVKGSASDSDEEIDDDVLDAAGEMGVAQVVQVAAQQQQQAPPPQQAGGGGVASSIANFFGFGGSSANKEGANKDAKAAPGAAAPPPPPAPSNAAADIMPIEAPRQKQRLFAAPQLKSALAVSNSSVQRRASPEREEARRAPSHAAAAGAAAPPPRVNRQQQIPTPKPVAKPKRAAIKAKADTNMVAVKFSTLAKKADDLAAGDPEHCKRCHAVLNSLSTLYDKAAFEKQKETLIKQQQVSSATTAAAAAAAAGNKKEAEPKSASGGAASAPPGGVALQQQQQQQQPSAAPAAAATPAPVASAAAASVRAAEPAPKKEAEAKKSPVFNASVPALDLGKVSLDDGDKLWMCEFCEHAQIVTLQEGEIPTKPSVDYVIEPAPVVDQKVSGSAGGGKGSAVPEQDETLVIFCIDVSGSMCVSKEIRGKFQLKGKAAKDAAGGGTDDLSFLAQFGNDYVRPTQSNTTWVSRLQAVQAAVDKQLEEVKAQYPHRRVALITFGDDVNVYTGDGNASAATLVVTGDKLNDQKQLQSLGRSLAINKPISDSFGGLSDKLWALSTGGKTALGPALVLAVSMAAAKKGSQIVVCTDGLANVGIGAMDKSQTDSEASATANWYEGVGQLAKLGGTMTSIISIKGDECSLENLGKVAEITGGKVDRVDPLELTKNFASILANPVIASNVSLTFLLHAGLQFRNEDTTSSVLYREIGNVTADSETTLEYGRTKVDHSRWAHLKALPFQVQIRYTAPNGMKAMRVLSHAQQVTTQRAVAEANVRVEMLAANVAQQSAKLAQHGRYREARVNNLAYAGLMNRVAQHSEQRDTYNNFMADLEQFDHVVAKQQVLQEANDDMDEAVGGGGADRKEKRGASPTMSAAPAPAAPPAPAGAGASFGSMSRSSAAAAPMRKKVAVADEAYKVMFQMKGKPSAMYSASNSNAAAKK